MQASVDHGTKQQQDQIIDSVEYHCIELTRDPFGNYIVQHILDLARPEVPLRIVMKLEVWYNLQTLIHKGKGQFHSLALLKFSSNVVDKCLKLGSDECVSRVLRELMDVTPTGTERKYFSYSTLLTV